MSNFPDHTPSPPRGFKTRTDNKHEENKNRKKSYKEMLEFNKPMYFGAKPSIFGAAHILRKNMTVQESLLWEKMKMKQINGLRFRRQHPIDIFIADFYCDEAKLVVEIDGEIHNSRKEYDIGRTAEMGKYGIKVIRFNNSEVENNIDDVVRRIEDEVKSRITNHPITPPSPSRGV